MLGKFLIFLIYAGLVLNFMIIPFSVGHMLWAFFPHSLWVIGLVLWGVVSIGILERTGGYF